MAAPYPMLFCVTGSLRGATLAPTDNPVTIGTEDGCSVRFPVSENPQVAPRHAIIVEQGGTFVIKAVSRQPLFVNGNPVVEMPLRHDDEIRMGEDGPLLRFRVLTERRTTKSFQQMIVDSAEFAQENGRRRSRVSRVTTFAHQLLREAVSNGTRGFRLMLGALAALVLVMAGLLGYSLWTGRHTEVRLREQGQQGDSLAAENERLRQILDAGRREQELLRNALLTETRDRDDMLFQLRAMLDREKDRDLSLQALVSRSERFEGDIEAMSSKADAARRIHESYHRGVCFIYIGVSFYNEEKGEFVRRAVGPDGLPDPNAVFPLTVGGSGEKFVEWVSGSGFLVTDDGLVVSNRHVMDPWYEDKEFGGGLLDRGYRTVREAFLACFPGREEPIPLVRVGIHPTRDVAVARLTIVDPDLPVLSLAADDHFIVSGEKTVLLGYPEGLRGLINKMETAVVGRALVESGGDQRVGLVRAITRLKGTRPTLTQGVLSDINADQLVYDAVTFSGGSGGPLFDEGGTVIGINTAISRQFTGANYGIPIRFARNLVLTEPLISPHYDPPEIPMPEPKIERPEDKEEEKVPTADEGAGKEAQAAEKEEGPAGGR
jgi:S1-C subfamily serine protease/pSer/pThr/pTyr-binding forkhead associated (FHA) protein